MQLSAAIHRKKEGRKKCMKEESIREFSFFQQNITELSEQGISMKAAKACIMKELLEADKQLLE